MTARAFVGFVMVQVVPFTETVAKRFLHGRFGRFRVELWPLTKVFVDNDDNFRHYVCMASHSPRPTEAELNILQVLWRVGPLSVRAVQQVLNQTKPTGYTTVLKMLQIMTEKGLVDRDDTVCPQIYRARYSQESTQRRLLSSQPGSENKKAHGHRCRHVNGDPVHP